MYTSHGLTPEQVCFYREEGYLTGLPPVFSTAEAARMNAELAQLMALLDPGEQAKEIREWHETSHWLYDLCMHPPILDAVESLIGPDFYLWASNFFIKEPRTRDRVGWHQDAYYWPLAPHNTVTVWLAFLDSDRENAAMQVIPRSHLGAVSGSGVRPGRRAPQPPGALESGKQSLACNALEVHGKAETREGAAGVDLRCRVAVALFEFDGLRQPVAA